MLDNYKSLQAVLDRAFKQASEGKGKERHANDLPFESQPMQQINSMVGIGFSHGQAIKKIIESQNMPPAQAVHELIGAINYIAGGIITLERQNALSCEIAETEYLEPILGEGYRLHVVNNDNPNKSSEWIKVPKGAVALTKADKTFLFWNEKNQVLNPENEIAFRDIHWANTIPEYLKIVRGHAKNASLVWQRTPPKPELDQVSKIFGTFEKLRDAIIEDNRAKARQLLSQMTYGTITRIGGYEVVFDEQGFVVSNDYNVVLRTKSLKEVYNYLFAGDL